MDELTQIESRLNEALDSISNIEPAIYDNDDGYALIMARNAQEKIETVLNYIRRRRARGSCTTERDLSSV